MYLSLNCWRLASTQRLLAWKCFLQTSNIFPLSVFLTGINCNLSDAFLLVFSAAIYYIFAMSSISFFSFLFFFLFCNSILVCCWILLHKHITRCCLLRVIDTKIHGEIVSCWSDHKLSKLHTTLHLCNIIIILIIYALYPGDHGSPQLLSLTTLNNTGLFTIPYLCHLLHKRIR